MSGARVKEEDEAGNDTKRWRRKGRGEGLKIGGKGKKIRVIKEGKKKGGERKGRVVNERC